MENTAKKRDFLAVEDFSRDELEDLTELALRMKRRGPSRLLDGKTLGLVFLKPSLRTRIAFEVAMYELGGYTVNLNVGSDVWAFESREGSPMDGTAPEHVKDAARTLSRYLDALAVRAAGPGTPASEDENDALIRTYARYATVPVINMESYRAHPCQALADVLTLKEHYSRLGGLSLSLVWTYQPDPGTRAVPNSVAVLAATFGLRVTVGHPPGFELPKDVLERASDAARASGGSFRVVNDLEQAVTGAQVVYASSWSGGVRTGSPPSSDLAGWRVDAPRMALASGARFLHPLPVRRNVAVTDEVLDSPASLVYEQVENRLHAQKALLCTLLNEA